MASQAAALDGQGTRAVKARDYRLDGFRGLALMFIFIDHIPDNLFSNFTLRSFAFCDAAEVFIFISGYTAALAYAPVFAREGVAMGFARIYRRVWQLYVAHICLFMIFNAEVAYTLKFLDNPLFADELQVGDYLDNPGEAFIRVLLLQFQPSLLNILPLYILLLIALPFLVLLMRRHVLAGLVPSGLLWASALMFGWNMPGFPEGRRWFFDPFTWQFLFTLAAALGMTRRGRAHRLPRDGALARGALVFVLVTGVVAASWSLHQAVPRIPQIPVLPEAWFDKTTLPPLRLIGVLALAVVVSAYVPAEARWLRARAGWLLVLCGQNSLELFCLSILLAVLANFVLSLVGYGILAQLLANCAGLAVMGGVGLMLAWFKAGGRLPAAPLPQAAA